ncbi:alpha-N-acetylgalactosaminide alpha-2,6-sialyltransferase 1 [Protobothrops mucrosquamatus]|uniref:alpha-N-acetylgalactosaminide alpha-2,6-sialyltransferase 1 n=1 Tax=Protobothrops mucrosquamatus TaxID=103944 RepID=UPI0007756A25|nr:alpha-N-acetylgalactosaminide alpha-2,6-sialyltransferase 1 [Protobothrops mucrosquamatus]
MRLGRKFPTSSHLFLLGFLFLIVSFAAYIGFTEKYSYSHFFSFQHIKKVPLFDIQNDIQELVATNPKPLELPDTRAGPGSSSLQKDPVNRLENYNVPERQAEFQDASTSLQKQTRSRLVVVETSQKSAEKKERPTASQNHAKTLVETQSSNKDGKRITPASNQKGETKKYMAPGNEEKEKAKAKRVTPVPPRKQSAGKAAKQPQFHDKNATLPSTANQTHLRKQSNKINLIKEHTAKASVSDVQQVTHPAPLATTPKRLKAADFKSEPRWKFDDIYLLDNSTPPSTCPDSLRNRAAKSDWLHDIFLPNITVFMDRSHFSDSEWKRMDHFAPPFGFMELNFSLVKEVISMLPPKPYQHILFARNGSQTSKCITCAVVGNGGILNNSRMGKEIDSHDYVFRVSGAVIKGYEKDVGTRTSFYGFTAFSLVTSVMILGNRGFKKIPAGKEIKYLHFLEGARDYEWLKALLLNANVRKGFLDYYGPRPRDKFDNFNLDQYFVIHPDFLRYTKNRFLKSKSLEKPYWRIYRPTTGAFLLLTALHLCDQVSAYGYITEGYQKYSDHYYDKERKRLIFYTNHDFDLERKVWKQLHDANIMKLYQRT